MSPKAATPTKMFKGLLMTAAVLLILSGCTQQQIEPSLEPVQDHNAASELPVIRDVYSDSDSVHSRVYGESENIDLP
ncbi:hypothetical protein [Paenibacillus lacisoli]|nr:hypothetical protein [Paenibacillus sp. JX-17]